MASSSNQPNESEIEDSSKTDTIEWEQPKQLFMSESDQKLAEELDIPYFPSLLKRKVKFQRDKGDRSRRACSTPREIKDNEYLRRSSRSNSYDPMDTSDEDEYNEGDISELIARSGNGKVSEKTIEDITHSVIVFSRKASIKPSWDDISSIVESKLNHVTRLRDDERVARSETSRINQEPSHDEDISTNLSRHNTIDELNNSDTINEIVEEKLKDKETRIRALEDASKEVLAKVISQISSSAVEILPTVIGKHTHAPTPHITSPSESPATRNISAQGTNPEPPFLGSIIVH